MEHIPELEHHCNSWVITRKSDGRVVGEFYERANVAMFDPEKVVIETAVVYLARINQEAKQ